MVERPLAPAPKGVGVFLLLQLFHAHAHLGAFSRGWTTSARFEFSLLVGFVGGGTGTALWHVAHN